MTRVVPAGDVVLIDPDAEMQLLDFERRTGRPTLVMWKFAPTNDADLITWYRRIELRRAVFEQGCGPGAHAFNVSFLLTTPARALRLVASCGPEIMRVGPWVLLRLLLRADSPLSREVGWRLCESRVAHAFWSQSGSALGLCRPPSVNSPFPGMWLISSLMPSGSSKTKK